VTPDRQQVIDRLTSILAMCELRGTMPIVEAADLRTALAMVSEPVIRVWRFEDAPAEYQALSPHGGDEDWVAHVPAALANEWIGWMDEGSSFGCFDVSRHPQPDGSEVRIGAHA